MEIDRLETAGGQCLASRESGRWVFPDGEGAAKPPLPCLLVITAPKKTPQRWVKPTVSHTTPSEKRWLAAMCGRPSGNGVWNGASSSP